VLSMAYLTSALAVSRLQDEENARIKVRAITVRYFIVFFPKDNWREMYCATMRLPKKTQKFIIGPLKTHQLKLIIGSLIFFLLIFGLNQRQTTCLKNSPVRSLRTFTFIRICVGDMRFRITVDS